MTAPGRLRKALVIGLTMIGALVVTIQLVPYGREHSNPRVVSEPNWDQALTRALAVRACFDCHSNETRWPWYSHVAPVSWLTQWDVDDGRRTLNLSEWNRTYEEADEAAEAVSEGEMPPAIYLLTHPSARLSPEEERALVQGLTATLRPGANAGTHED